MTDVGMENDGMGHIHTWERDGGDCLCGAPVPRYLIAAWNRFAESNPADS
jgi:hypothetical protein